MPSWLEVEDLLLDNVAHDLAMFGTSPMTLGVFVRDELQAVIELRPDLQRTPSEALEDVSDLVLALSPDGLLLVVTGQARYLDGAAFGRVVQVAGVSSDPFHWHSSLYEVDDDGLLEQPTIVSDERPGGPVPELLEELLDHAVTLPVSAELLCRTLQEVEACGHRVTLAGPALVQVGAYLEALRLRDFN